MADEAPEGDEEPAEEFNLAATEAPPPDGLAETKTRPVDLEPRRDKIRGCLALGLLALTGALAIMAFALTAAGDLTTAQLDKLEPIFAALVTLTGTATGFYFGGHRR